jgi:hypothetical protein
VRSRGSGNAEHSDGGLDGGCGRTAASHARCARRIESVRVISPDGIAGGDACGAPGRSADFTRRDSA